MSQTIDRGGRIEGLAAAFQFARIPLVCALIVALVNTNPFGRTLAIVLGALVLVAGVALNAGQIFLGRPAWRAVPSRATVRARSS